MSVLYPDFYYDSVFEIPYQELYAKNIRGLIFDLDSTLAPRDMPKPTAKIVGLIKKLQKMGFNVSLLSNNTGKRLNAFNERLQLVSVNTALKPLTFGLKNAMRAMGTGRETTALIGDQIFTDVLCGKSARIMTILVKPLPGKEFITVRIKRIFERPLLKAFHKKN